MVWTTGSRRRANAVRFVPRLWPADVVDALAGIIFLALITHAETMDEAWMDRTAEFIARGISA